MKNEIVLFENQNVKLEVNLKDETVWLNTEQMAQFIGVIAVMTEKTPLGVVASGVKMRRTIRIRECLRRKCVRQKTIDSPYNKVIR